MEDVMKAFYERQSVGDLNEEQVPKKQVLLRLTLPSTDWFRQELRRFLFSTSNHRYLRMRLGIGLARCCYNSCVAASRHAARE
jgi:hypothetical protein